MPKLNDTQTILLSVASRRNDLAVHPLEGVTAGTAVTKAIASLVKAGFAERRGGDAVFATLAGLTAIGVDLGQGDEEPVTGSAPPAPRTTKSAAVLELLRREQGATLPDLIAATGWLPHTTRAALTGLRKKGHAIAKTKRDGVTYYKIDARCSLAPDARCTAPPPAHAGSDAPCCATPPAPARSRALPCRAWPTPGSPPPSAPQPSEPSASA
jgi:hypothetical protein